MKELIGRPGSVSGLLLRIGQFAFAAAAIGVMVSANRFATFTAFCYLIASMGLQALWSFGLACLDIYALRRKRDLQNPILVSLFVVGDWVTATLSLAAASASAGIVVLYARDEFLHVPMGYTMPEVPDFSSFCFPHLGLYCHIFSCDVLDPISIGLEICVVVCFFLVPCR